jgi:hypothetical protein
MRFEPVPRTNQAKTAGEQVRINMVRTSNGETITLDIPDFSGETFRKHFENREWDPEFRDAIADLQGIVLFINPDDLNNRPRLLILENEYKQILGIKEDNDVVDFVPYDTSHTSNQVKLVDCLQFIEKYGRIARPIKISIAISMWDRLELVGNKLTPEEWTKLQLPLLYQYMFCNSEIFETKYFGVSSQGGNYDDRESLAVGNAMERVKVVEGTVQNHDICRPILWITE